MGNLMAYEVLKNGREDQESNQNSIALNTDSNSKASDSDEDLTLMTWKFKKLLKKGKSFRHMCRRTDHKSNNQRKDNQES